MPYKRGYKTTRGDRAKRGSAMSRYKKPPAKKKGGLNKTETKQVRAIAKKTVLSNAESKYFNSTPLGSLKRLLPFASRAGANTSVRGFAVGTGVLGGTPNEIMYGVSGGATVAIDDLNMCRLFNGLAGNPYDQNVLEGSYCAPSMCKTEWTLTYPYINTTANETGATPVYVRMIRVKPRKVKYSDVAIQPRSDLFLDQYGASTGISMSSFNDMELQHYAVNRRKYEVIQDVTRELLPTMTVATLQIADGNTLSTDIENKRNEWKFTLNHKQPKKLYYEDATTTGVQPKAGQSAEMIFFHFCNIGINGSATQNGDEIRITCKPCSTFKDI